MFNEMALLESRSLRTSVGERTDVLDRVRTLSLLPDGLHVTTAMVATYFEVGVKAIESLVFDHRDELVSNGYQVLTGAALASFKEASHIQSRAPRLALFPRRAVLDVAMLLRDSDVARQVRTYLLDTEFLARTRTMDTSTGPPVENTESAESLDDRIDQRIAHVLSRSIVPMFNALIETSGEHRRELVTLREGVQHIERRLAGHRARLRRLEQGRLQRPRPGVMAAMDAMNWREFEHHVAGLLHRDGCTDVVVRGGRGDRGVDVTARTADGRTVAVQCKRYAPFRSVWSGEVQKFVGAAKVLHRAEVALYVATCQFSQEAADIAAAGGVTVVHRPLLETWSAGTPLDELT